MFACDCSYRPETDDLSMACGEEAQCVNREIYLECSISDCPTGGYCQNRRFQKKEYAPIRVVDTGKKGFGLVALAAIEPNQFIMEYIGEVVTHVEFSRRAIRYHADGRHHHYFMSLTSSEYIDATRKGSWARFMNHSCRPNCVLQKWTVGNKLRMGMFSSRKVAPGEELTFDYQFQRYGAEAQPCYCGESVCKGYIG
ncbi:MAG: putative huntingtin interacting protein, partial [Piptocephalis tieghemiana]